MLNLLRLANLWDAIAMKPLRVLLRRTWRVPSKHLDLRGDRECERRTFSIYMLICPQVYMAIREYKNSHGAGIMQYASFSRKRRFCRARTLEFSTAMLLHSVDMCDGNLRDRSRDYREANLY